MNILPHGAVLGRSTVLTRRFLLCDVVMPAPRHHPSNHIHYKQTPGYYLTVYRQAADAAGEAVVPLQRGGFLHSSQLKRLEQIQVPEGEKN